VALVYAAAATLTVSLQYAPPNSTYPASAEVVLRSKDSPGIAFSGQWMTMGTWRVENVTSGDYVLTVCADNLYWAQEEIKFKDGTENVPRSYSLDPSRIIGLPQRLIASVQPGNGGPKLENFRISLYSPCSGSKFSQVAADSNTKKFYFTGLRIRLQDQRIYVSISAGGPNLTTVPSVQIPSGGEADNEIQFKVDFQKNTILASVQSTGSPRPRSPTTRSASASYAQAARLVPANFFASPAEVDYSVPDGPQEAMGVDGVQTDVPPGAPGLLGLPEGAVDEAAPNEDSPSEASALAIPGANIVTKSGGNDWHGSASFLAQNDLFGTHAFFQLPGFTTWQQEQAEVAAGGGILKNSLFVFAATDLSSTREAPSFGPNAISQIAAIDNYKSLLGLPAENLRQYTPSTALLLSLLKLDWRPGERSVFSASFLDGVQSLKDQLYAPQAQTSPLPSTAYNATDRSRMARVKYSWTGGDWEDEFSFANRLDTIPINPLAPDQVSAAIPGVAAVGRSNSLGYGDGYQLGSNQASGRIGRFIGRHHLSAAVIYNRQQHRLSYSSFEAGRIISPQSTLDLFGTVTADLTQKGGVPQSTLIRDSIGMFAVGDTYRLGRNWSVDAGLQIALQTLPSALNGSRVSYQPHIGMAWDVRGNGNTVIRIDGVLLPTGLPVAPLGYQNLLGGGLSGFNLQPADPPSSQQIQSYTDEGNLATLAVQSLIQHILVPFLIPQPQPQPLPDQRLAVVYDPNARVPHLNETRIKIAQRLWTRNTVEFSYKDTGARDLLTSTDANLLPPTYLNGMPNFQFLRMNPLYSQIFEFQSAGTGSYQTGQIEFRRSSFRGMSLFADYWLSHNIDDVASGSFEMTPEDVYNRRRDRALSDLNLGQRLEVGTAVRGEDLLANAYSKLTFLHAVYLESTMAFQSGRYYNVLAGSDILQDGNPLTGRPRNLGRNTFEGADLAQVDIRVGWRHDWAEGNRGISIFVQAVNVANRANFTGYDTVLGDTAGIPYDPRILSGARNLTAVDFGKALGPNGFGEAIEAATPRRLALGVRFRF
jgi:hypothetical protein